MGKSIAAEMDAVLKTYPGVSVYRRGSRAEGHSPASRWYLGKKLSAVILHHLDGDIRRIPRSIILNGSVEQLSALYQGLLEGDGSSQDGVGWTHFYPGLDEGLADDFQELALRLGFGTTKRKVKGRNDFCVSIADKRSSSHWLRKPTRRRYDGVVWDITVPTGAFVARRNGRIFVTGNCPQRIMDREGDAAKLYGMMETIVRRGRIKGFIPWLISQRPAVISKDVLSQADGIVAFKLTSSQDRDAIGDWVQGQADKKTWAEIWSSLPTMERGQGVVWLPGRGVLDTVQFPVKETFDSSRTPKRGERSHRTAALRPIDLGKVKERLATVEAEVKANDPRALRVQLIEKDKVISELRNELTLKSTTAAPDKDAMRKAEERGFEQAKKKLTAAAQREAKEVLLSGMTAIRSHIGRLTADVDDELKKLRAANVDVGEMVTFTPSAPVQVVRAGPSPAAKPIRAAAAQRADGAIERPLQLIVDAIRWWNVMGIRAPSHAQVAFVAGYSHKSGTWATYLSRLRSLNYIEGRGDLVLTDHGSAVVNDPPEPPSGEQLRATVIAKIDAPLQKILRPILRAYPEALSHQVAGEQAGYSPSSGTWATYLSRLRSLDLIDGRGELRAQDWLFPSVPHLTSVSAR
ncbi:MAG: hypothetical protein KGL35_16520 [Bradyrhizobium sp.]|nr:hypothetical protein [Bradyrhizobium sp.]